MSQKPSPWPLPPLFQGDWREIPDDLADDLRLRVHEPSPRPAEPSPGVMSRFRVLPLRCYPEWLAVEAQIGDDDGSTVASFLYGPYGPFMLTGQSDVLHDINEHCGVLLDNEAARHSYLRLFTSAVRGDEGPFFLVEDEARLIDLSGRTPPPGHPAHGLARPIRSVGEKRGAYMYEAVVFYGGSLFEAVFSITNNGAVSMDDDTMIAENFAPPRFDFDGPVRRLTL